MIQVVFYILIFLIGIYFGSFFTLAVYRIPNKENIIYKHSYCPNCNHKLAVLDLVPIFSYIFLGGKCRYCKKKIRLRYLLLELLTGIVFVIFAKSINIDLYSISVYKIIYLVLGILYFSSLFIISGIDKEKNVIQKSVLFYGIAVSLTYMVYSCTLNKENIYGYVIYLVLMMVLMVIDTELLKQNLKYDYLIQILILIINMVIFSGEYTIIFTIILSILSIGIKNIIDKVSNNKQKSIKKNENANIPVGFFLSISNIISIIIINFISNYTI